jgi:hypothetical protein
VCQTVERRRHAGGSTEKPRVRSYFCRVTPWDLTWNTTAEFVPLCKSVEERTSNARKGM